MKTCLICNQQEPGARTSDPDVDIICHACTSALLKATPEEKIKNYIEAIARGQPRVAYAPHTFVPKKIRKKYPLKKWR